MTTNLKKYMRMTELALDLDPGKWFVYLNEDTNGEGKGCTSIFWREESDVNYRFHITADGMLKIEVFKAGTNDLIKELNLQVLNEDSDSEELEDMHEFLSELKHLVGKTLAQIPSFDSWGDIKKD